MVHSLLLKTWPRKTTTSVVQFKSFVACHNCLSACFLSLCTFKTVKYKQKCNRSIVQYKYLNICHDSSDCPHDSVVIIILKSVNKLQYPVSLLTYLVLLYLIYYSTNLFYQIIFNQWINLIVYQMSENVHDDSQPRGSSLNHFFSPIDTWHNLQWHRID